MRSCLRMVLSSLVLSSAMPLAAQMVEGLEVMPGRLSGATPGITTVFRHFKAGFPVFEALQQYPAAYLQGVGDMTNTSRALTTSRCEINTVKLRYQDENGATSEGFKLVVRAAGSVAGTADLSQTLFTQDVPGAPATSAGPAGFLVTVQIMKSSKASAIEVPSQASFFVGMECPKVPSGSSWPATDGLSVAVSYYDKFGSLKLDYDWPKGGNAAADMAYVVSAGVGSFPSPKMSFGIALVPDAPILQVGAWHEKGSSRHGADRGFGTAGFWPEVDPTTPRGALSQDGLSIRLSDGRYRTAGSYSLFFSLANLKALSQAPIALTGIGGSVYLGPPILFAGGGALASADHVIDLSAPKSLPTSLLGIPIYLQAMTVVGGVPHLSNMAGIGY